MVTRMDMKFQLALMFSYLSVFISFYFYFVSFVQVVLSSCVIVSHVFLSLYELTSGWQYLDEFFWHLKHIQAGI